MQATYHKLLITMHYGTNIHSACITNKHAQEKKDVVKRVRLYTYVFIARHIFREMS